MENDKKGTPISERTCKRRFNFSFTLFLSNYIPWVRFITCFKALTRQPAAACWIGSFPRRGAICQRYVLRCRSAVTAADDRPRSKIVKRTNRRRSNDRLDENAVGPHKLFTQSWHRIRQWVVRATSISRSRANSLSISGLHFSFLFSFCEYFKNNIRCKICYVLDDYIRFW